MRQIISMIAILLLASVACGGMQAPRKLVAAATGGGSAPTFHSGSGGTNSSTSGGSFTFTHTVNSSLTNAVAVVEFWTYSESSAPTSVTYNGTGLSQLGTLTYSGDNLFKSYLYGGAVGSLSAATNNVVVTVGNGTDIGVTCLIFSGGAQSSTFGTFGSTNTSTATTSQSLNVSSASNEYPIAVLNTYGTPGTVTDNQTSVYTAAAIEAISTKTGSGTTSFSWSTTNSVGYLASGISIKGL